jgi:DNA polymerase-1
MPIITQKQSPDVLIVDCDHMAYRAFYVHQELCTSTGLSSGVFYGILSMIHTQLQRVSPKNIVLTWGAEGSGKKRKEMYEGYKANRPKHPNFRSQIKDVQYFFSCVGWEQYYNDQGWEADDVIASLVNFYKSTNSNIYVLSGDHDFHQLVDNNVTCIVPGTKSKPDVVYTPEIILQKYGITSDKLPDVYAISGEEGDGIVGIPSIGLKTAIKLIKAIGSVEELIIKLENLDIPERTKTLIRNNKDIIVRNKKLVNLRFSNVDLCAIDQNQNADEAQAMLNIYEIKKFKATDFCRDK